MSSSSPAIVVSYTVDPHEMSLRGRIGAAVLHSRHDPKETTRIARETFMGRFEREVDPDGVLPDGERQRRAASAKKAYFARLAYASAKSRKANHSGGKTDTSERGER